jgi:hypothetical protein
MSLVLAAALAASTATLPACSWDRPGANPFMGNVVAAVDRYADIPASVRQALKKRMAARQYDEIATIRRDAIAGTHQYTDLREMHFGQGQVCQTVTRNQWAAAAVERGLVYCESGHCLIVPTVCRNLSRVTRSPAHKAAATERGGGGGGSSAGATAGELQFDPPSAGATPAEPAATFAGRTVEALPSPLSGPVSHGSESAPGFVGAGSAPTFVSSAGLAGGGGGGGGDGGPAGGDGADGDPRTPLLRETLGLQSGPTLPPPLPVTATPVPEPATWALMAVGLVLSAAAGRRRRRLNRA